MSDTTWEDPAHFWAPFDPYPHQESPGCPCSPERSTVDDYAGLGWFVLHRSGGPGGAVYEIPRAPGYGGDHG